MMYLITSKAGEVFGPYEGDTKKDAFMAMLEHAGSAADYGEPHVGTEADWIITEAPGVGEPRIDHFGDEEDE